MIRTREESASLAAFLRTTELFRGADDAAIAAFAEKFQRVPLPGGKSLECRDWQCVALFVVRRGRVRVEVPDRPGRPGRPARDGAPAVLELRAGDFFGELSVLGGDEHGASVFAVRDSELLAVAAPDFKEIAAVHTDALWTMTRLAVERVWALVRSAPADSPVSNVAFLPATASEHNREVARDLVRGLGSVCSTLHLDAARLAAELGAEAAGVEWDDPRNAGIAAWLDEREAQHRFVLYEANEARDAWTSRCLRQADRILIAAPAGMRPDLDAMKHRYVFEDRCCLSEVRVDVLLFHPADTELPSGATAWREREETQHVYHVRRGHAADYARVARCLTNRPVGLVLGGGGARGIAHVGVLKALEEASIPVDLVGGTSIGSIFAAGRAMGWDADAMLERTREVFRRRRALIDVTFPYLSLLSGAKLTRVLQRLFGDARIEDLWLPYFCVSVSLTGARVAVHDRGELWRQVRSSCALPGIFPPVHTGDELLVDGGVMNNLPTDVMARRGQGGTVIAVDVSGSDEGVGAPFESEVSGWGALRRRLSPSSALRTLNIFDVLLRSTVVSSRSHGMQRLQERDSSLHLRPPVGGFGVLDFGALEDLYRIGYEHAKAELESWSGMAEGCH